MHLHDKESSSTNSSDDYVNYQSSLRMLQSDQLTPYMAVNYLFEWRDNDKLLIPLLTRVYKFCLNGCAHFLPTIIFIMSLSPNLIFYKFCEKLARSSFALYLLVRWSYSTYLSKEKIRYQLCKRLDVFMIPRFQEYQFSYLSEEDKGAKIKYKFELSTYIDSLNEYYAALFKIPEKLKKRDRSVRNLKLEKCLKKLSNKFFQYDYSNYLNGIALPLDHPSNIAVTVLQEYCFTFSTKERVPFKVAFETISQEDAMRLKGRTVERSGSGIYNIFISGDCQPYSINYEKESEDSRSLLLPHTYFGKEYTEERVKIAKYSAFRHLNSYRIRSFIVKSGDDFRQYYMAMQLIKLIASIVEKENLKIWLRPYSVTPYNNESGLIEFIYSTRTISDLKYLSGYRSLRVIYKQIFGDNWETAVLNFVSSLAGYSLIQYLFQIKDRHNNNILVDAQGHIIHIDFSFIISSSPGNMNFEKAPFKLTQDYMEMMEGADSPIFQHFKLLFFLGLKYIRKYHKEIMDTILMMTNCYGMKCFDKFNQNSLYSRFLHNKTDAELLESVNRIVDKAYNSYRTVQYDYYQWYTSYIYA